MTQFVARLLQGYMDRTVPGPPPPVRGTPNRTVSYIYVLSWCVLSWCVLSWCVLCSASRGEQTDRDRASLTEETTAVE